MKSFKQFILEFEKVHMYSNDDAIGATIKSKGRPDPQHKININTLS